MYSRDLATECEVASGPAVRAIGWLEQGQPYPTGPVDRRFLEALRSHVHDPGYWYAVYAMGPHRCDLAGCTGAMGSQHVVIPSATCVYVAPTLVVHYVEEHHYAPPAEFVAAVLACPEQSSAAYVELLMPFASVWRLSPEGVRTIASRAPERRAAHAAAEAQRLANRGNFKF